MGTAESKGLFISVILWGCLISASLYLCLYLFLVFSSALFVPRPESIVHVSNFLKLSIIFSIYYWWETGVCVCGGAHSESRARCCPINGSQEGEAEDGSAIPLA